MQAELPCRPRQLPHHQQHQHQPPCRHPYPQLRPRCPLRFRRTRCCQLQGQNLPPRYPQRLSHARRLRSRRRSDPQRRRPPNCPRLLLQKRRPHQRQRRSSPVPRLGACPPSRSHPRRLRRTRVRPRRSRTRAQRWRRATSRPKGRSAAAARFDEPRLRSMLIYALRCIARNCEDSCRRARNTAQEPAALQQSRARLGSLPYGHTRPSSRALRR
jgi:hypothetical protein